VLNDVTMSVVMLSDIFIPLLSVIVLNVVEPSTSLTSTSMSVSVSTRGVDYDGKITYHDKGSFTLA
jgi:hypothetical protein